MSRIVIECKVCGTRIVTADMAEVKSWNDGHDARCVGPDLAAIKAEQVGGTVIGWAVVDHDGVAGTELDSTAIYETRADADHEAELVDPVVGGERAGRYTIAALVEPGD